MILDDGIFKDLLQINKIYFSGSGAVKMKEILDNKNAVFADNEVTPDSMAELSYRNYIKKHFANISSASPIYLKEFYTLSPGG